MITTAKKKNNVSLSLIGIFYLQCELLEAGCFLFLFSNISKQPELFRTLNGEVMYSFKREVQSLR